MENSSAILISAFIAGVGWWTTQRANRSSERKKHTYDLIKTTLNDKKIDCYIKHLRQRRIEEGVTPADLEASQPDWDKYHFLLNHYEYICAALLEGELDEALIQKTLRSQILVFGDYFKPFIEYYRSKSGANGSQQSSAWENLYVVADRWENFLEKRGLLHLTLEWFLMRPVSPDWKNKTIEKLSKAAKNTLNGFKR